MAVCCMLQRQDRWEDTLLLRRKKNFGKGGYFFICPGIVLFPGKMRPFKAPDGSGIRKGTSNRINLFYKPC